MPDFGRWTSNGGDPSLNEVNRTDRFLDSLAFDQPVYATDPGEAELAHLLAGWRDDVRDAPLTAALTPRDAVLALDRATTSRGRTRATLAVVGSVAAAVLCLGGFGAVVAGAGPGDALYGLRTMLFGEQQATREDPVMLASQQLAEVQQLIDQGQWDAAQDKLQTLTTTVATVNDVERKQEFVSEWQELTVKVEAQDAQATVPPNVPPPVFPDVPAVVLDTTTSTAPSDTTTTSPSDATTTSPSDVTTTSPSDTTTSPSDTTTTSPSPTPSPPTSAPTTSVQQPPSSAPTLLPAPTPLPTPTSVTALPTPTADAPLPTPTADAPLPTPTADAPLPTPTSRPPSPTPQPTTSAVQQDEEEPTVEQTTSEEQPTLEAPAPRTVITTTVVKPEPDDE